MLDPRVLAIRNGDNTTPRDSARSPAHDGKLGVECREPLGRFIDHSTATLHHQTIPLDP